MKKPPWSYSIFIERERERERERKIGLYFAVSCIPKFGLVGPGPGYWQSENVQIG